MGLGAIQTIKHFIFIGIEGHIGENKSTNALNQIKPEETEQTEPNRCNQHQNWDG